MADNQATVQLKADISSLKAAMQQAARQVRVANSEFKAATAGMDDWNDSAEGLRAKLKQLDSILAAQKTQVEKANEAYEKTVKVYGKNSAEADRAKISLNGYIGAMNQTQREIEKYTQELKDCENETGRFAKSTDELDSATQKASEGFTVMKGALANLVADGIRAAISALKDLAQETFTVGANFEQEMAKVGAISGANTDEIDALTEKAKEMGETTVFSATESAEAFEFMAMAGWKTEDMLNGIGGLMSLAAASGEDLGTTADIVTDALTAMGYGAQDAAKLADVMAAASSNANTNVKLMGDTFKYAAPIAGSLGYNMEDMAVAIGLMANAGVKGTMAGTALSSIMTRLSVDTDGCASNLKEMGVEVVNSDGSMRDFSDVMVDLRKHFSELSDVEQTALAKNIAGQEAMKGLLAIVNASEDDFNKLTKAVNNSSGAAEDMANTMNDTVNGQVTLLKSKVEGIMIKIFENASDSIREAIDQISEALDKVNWDEVGKKVGDIVKKLVDFFKDLIKNSDKVINTLKKIAITLATVFVVDKIYKFTTAIVGLVKAVGAIKGAMVAAEGATGLLGAAMSALPIVAVGAAVAGLVAGVVILANRTDDYVEVVAHLTEAEQENIDKVHKLKESYDDMKSSRDAAVQDVETEYRYYEDLRQELDSLVGANGKVKEGYEDRVAFILSELNSALNTEMTMTDGVIENYAKERQELERLMETQKAQAILEANRGAYSEALQNVEDAELAAARALNTYNDTLERMSNTQAEVTELEKKAAAAWEQAGYNGGEYVDIAQSIQNELDGTKQRLKEEELAHYESIKSLNEAQEAYEGYATEIKNFQDLATIVETGEGDIDQALNNLENDFKDAETATVKTLEAQVRTYEDNLKQLKDAQKQGMKSVTNERIKQAEDLVKREKAELEKAKENASQLGTQTSQAYADGMRNAEGQVIAAAESVGQSGTTTLGHHVNEAQTLGESWVTGYARGIMSQLDAVKRAAENAANTAKKSTAEAQDSHSPSKVAEQLGKWFSDGYIEGITSQYSKIQSSVKGMVTLAVKEMAKMSNYNFEEVGQNASTKFANAMSAKTSFMLDKMKYQNEKKLKAFDDEIANIQKHQSDMEAAIQLTQDKETAKAMIASNKEKYDALIAEQRKYKEAYSKASSQMISEFNTAIKDYQTKAQALIDDTIKGITDRYTNRYDDLVNKQDTLIEKLKGAGDLFNISGAGVMTVNDLKEQTKSIEDYTKKLQKIKGKVSSELFDQIATYDMTEGSAFMSQLLSMSKKDLEAYNKAYTEKIQAAQKAGESTYKADFKQISKDYEKEINSAFKGLDKEMQELGTQAMKGFVQGLTTNTSYMDKEIKDFVNAMVGTFKKELKIKSPSRVMMSLGDYTGQGFIDGLKETIGAVKKTASDIAQSVAVPLGNYNGIKSAVSSQGAVSAIGGGTVNNYNLIQNNTSPKALSALETYRARRQQIAMIKAVT